MPLVMACPNIDLAAYMMQHGASLGGLSFRQCFEMFATNDALFLEFLVNESGALNINEVDPASGHTCLITAAEANDIKKMNFLLKFGADPDCRFPEDAEQRVGMTLLHEACLKGKVEQAKLLLSYGANFNLKCNRGRTTLDFLRTGHEAKSNRRREELKSLLYKYTVKVSILNK
jgi:ankyrin repeat protein